MKRRRRPRRDDMPIASRANIRGVQNAIVDLVDSGTVQRPDHDADQEGQSAKKA